MKKEGLPVLECFSGLVEAREVFSATALLSPAKTAEYLGMSFLYQLDTTLCRNRNGQKGAVHL